MIDTPNIERVIKQGKPIFSGKTTAKDFRSWLQHKIGVFSKKDNEEYRQVFMSILNAYNYYEPEKKIEVEVDSWHGHSSFEIIKDIDKLTIIKYQKKVKGDEPTEVRTEVSKEELQALVDAIKHESIKNFGGEIKTKILAMKYCYTLGYSDILNGEFWKNFFSNRKLHNKFTLMLGALDKLGFIEYKGGKTKLLNKDISIQLIL